MTPYPIIGMSPGNSYFKDAEVEHLLKTTVERFGKAAILIADIPAIATYIAYGYPENRARNKAIPKGNNLKNRSRRIAEKLGISNQVRIIDWENEVENSPQYQEIYSRIRSLYESNKDFEEAIDNTTASVLEGSDREIPDVPAATKIAVHYLLSELSFLEFALEFLQTEAVTYVYHRNWPVYERYVNGVYDGVPKPHLDFLLLEHPTETYKTRGDEQMAHIASDRVLRCAFSNLPPSFIENPETGEFSGIFYDILCDFAKAQNWEIDWSEEVGYGVIQDGLNGGRFDIFAAAVWPVPERQQIAQFSEPVYFSDVQMVVRAEDLEQTKTSDFLTNTFVRAAIKEGDITDSIVNADFPAWKRVRVPQLTDTEELLLFVAAGDADVTFVEQHLVDLFNEKSRVRLTNTDSGPIRTFANCFMLSKENNELTALLNDYLASNQAVITQLILQYAPQAQTQGIKSSQDINDL